MQIEDGVPVAVAKTVRGFPLPFVGVALLAVLVVVGAMVAVLNAGKAQTYKSRRKHPAAGNGKERRAGRGW